MTKHINLSKGHCAGGDGQGTGTGDAVTIGLGVRGHPRGMGLGKGRFHIVFPESQGGRGDHAS